MLTVDVPGTVTLLGEGLRGESALVGLFETTVVLLFCFFLLAQPNPLDFPSLLASLYFPLLFL